LRIDDISILAESKTQLSAILNVFSGMTLSPKSPWVTLGCSLDTSDREAFQLPCGPVGYAESFKYLVVELTSDLTDTADIVTKLSRGRGIFNRCLKHSAALLDLPVKLRVKLFHTLIVPTVLHHGCECWTMSRAVFEKLNVFQSRCLRKNLGARWQDHVSNKIVRSRCSVPMSLAQLVRFRTVDLDGLEAGHVLRHNELIVHEVMFSRTDSE